MAKFKTSKEIKELCKAWKQSGLSKSKFCLLNNTNLRTFYGWLKRLRKKDYSLDDKTKDLYVDLEKATNKRDRIKFLKIPTKPSSNTGEDLCYLEIALPNGINFKIKLLTNNMDKFLMELLTWK